MGIYGYVIIVGKLAMLERKLKVSKVDTKYRERIVTVHASFLFIFFL